MSAGLMMLDQNRPADALAYFEAAEDGRAWFGRAVALQMLGRLDEAEAAYLRVPGSQPNEEVLSNLVALAVEKFDLERVERYSRRLLEASPDAAIGWQGLLVVALERGDFHSAAEYFRQIEGRPAAADDRAVQYRISGQVAERLKGIHGAIARAR